MENFEGPLDLLLYFIRRDEIDIYDIPIARITAEFMETLDRIKELNLANAGEFIHMAATLMRIKAKMLLPVTAGEDEDFEDPRQDLVQKLLEYQQYKEAAKQLDGILEERSPYFPRSMVNPAPPGEDDPSVYLKDIGLYEIARYFKHAMERMPVIQSYELVRENINLEDQRRIILAGFNEDGRQTFSQLMNKLGSKLEMVVTFLAILDLMRQAIIRVIQSRVFDDLELVLVAHKS
ncbi:MAG: segregation and condensation protein A [Fidelibacterota bacterium]